MGESRRGRPRGPERVILVEGAARVELPGQRLGLQRRLPLVLVPRSVLGRWLKLLLRWFSAGM